MKPRAACLSLLALLAIAASPARAADAPTTPADRLAAPAALPEMPLEGDFYLVKTTGGEGPSYMRPGGAGQADGWLVEVLREPETTDKGPADVIAGYFHFDCEAGSAEILSMVFYSAKGRVVDRLDQRIVPKFVEDSPIWLLKEAACGRPPANLDRFTSLEAVVADAAPTDRGRAGRK